MADPHLFTPISDRSVGPGAEAMDTEEETGEKSGGKGVEYEADGENVNVAASTGDSDDLDGNRTQREAVRCTDAIEGSHDSVTGQDLMETGWSAKNLDLGVMETTGNNTGTTAQYDGEPTESDVIYNLDGSVGFRDRSLGGERQWRKRSKTPNLERKRHRRERLERRQQ
jgi:hypothetical protein